MGSQKSQTRLRDETTNKTLGYKQVALSNSAVSAETTRYSHQAVKSRHSSSTLGVSEEDVESRLSALPRTAAITPAVSVETKHLRRPLTSADSNEDPSPGVKDAERNFTFYGSLKLMRQQPSTLPPKWY